MVDITQNHSRVFNGRIAGIRIVAIQSENGLVNAIAGDIQCAVACDALIDLH